VERRIEEGGVAGGGGGLSRGGWYGNAGGGRRTAAYACPGAALAPAGRGAGERILYCVSV